MNKDGILTTVFKLLFTALLVAIYMITKAMEHLLVAINTNLNNYIKK